MAEIGSGGMGVVYKAEDTKLRRTVALKFLPPELNRHAEAKERFIREAHAAAALDHPHIGTIFEVGEHEDTAFIAMAYIEGQSLREKIARQPLSTDEALDLAIQVAEGLEEAHKRGIIHRDIKCANIMVTEKGQAKIMDFGLAKMAGESLITKEAKTMGTVAYMSPEQARGEVVDQRTDIWSLGVVLYEMLTDKLPFKGGHEQAVIYSILHEEPEALSKVRPDIASGLEQIVGKALSKNPANRYQTMEEFREDLKAVAAGLKPLKAKLRLGKGRIFGIRMAYIYAGLALLAVLFGLNVGGLRNRFFARGAAATHSIKLAVLPFVNLTGDPEQEYLSDGLTQEMIAQLGRLHPQNLSVIARTSVMRYKKSETPIDQIGRDLGVEYVLEGSAQREGSRVRISAELIQVKDQTQLWADTYDREMSGILALQNDVAEKVAKALALKLLPSERGSLARARPINPEAYDAYLKGLQHVYIFLPADIETALQYFELALKKDPNYAPPYAGISLVWTFRKTFGWTPSSEATPKAKAAALKAVALDDTVAVAHYALALVMTWSDWDWAGAESEFKRAIELNPSFPDARAYYSHLLIIMGRPEEALAQGEKALELDPLNPLIRSLYANGALFYARRYDDAIAQARNVLRTSPDHLAAHYALWYAYSKKGMYKEALSSAKVYLNSCYPNPDTADALDRGYAEGGYPVAMKRAADALAAHSRTANVIPEDIAGLYEQAGEKDHALEWLQKGFESHGPGMPYLGLYYDSLRSDPRFQDWLRRMNLPLGEKK